jgi:hypothetical protein
MVVGEQKTKLGFGATSIDLVIDWTIGAIPSLVALNSTTQRSLIESNRAALVVVAPRRRKIIRRPIAGTVLGLFHIFLESERDV